MPLGLIAIGSALDRDAFDVQLIDARLHDDPVGLLVREAKRALCVGITVLTGAPILGALEATRALAGAAPDLPVIWGGWHPSLFPEQCVEAGGARAAVGGQGEQTFRELVERLSAGAEIAGCRGCTHRAGERTVREIGRDLAPLDELPTHDYGLVDVERYFAGKKRRQLDFVTSQGCPFRCAFCADPAVFGRRWTGLSAGRIVDEVAHLKGRHGFGDLAFQDETFFTSSRRVGEMCEGFLAKSLRLTWTATMRADQGVRLDEEVWRLARRSGLRRVLVGVESGDPEMLVRIEKDITLDQVFETAERCRRHGVAAAFPFIVGMPGETDRTVEATFACARRLREMDPAFEIAMFFYKPYPGNPLADRLAAMGHPLPETIDEWARFDFVNRSSPWISPALRREVERFRFYQRTGYARGPWWRVPERAIARLRCRMRRFELPVEKLLIERVRPPASLT